MSIHEVIGNGDFMPVEFWVATTWLLGVSLCAILVFIIKRFLDRLDTSIDSLKDNVQELKESNRLTQQRLQQHELDIQELQKRKR